MRKIYKNGKRKAFTMIELVFVIIAIGVFVSAAYVNLTSENAKANFANDQKDVLIDIHKGLIEWYSHRYDQDGTYSTLTPTVAKDFFPKFDLVGGKLVPKKLKEATIDFLPAKNSFGTNDATYKILFDYSKVKSKLNWSDAEATQEEHRIASYYRGLASTSVTGGQSTSLGAANVDLAETAPNADAIIAITYAR